MLEKIKFIPEDELNMLQLAWNPVKKEIEPLITLGKCEIQITGVTPISVQINLPQDFKEIIKQKDPKPALIKICKSGIENVICRDDVLDILYNEFEMPENTKEILEFVDRLYNNYVEDIYFTNFLKTISSEYGTRIYDPDLYSQIKPLFSKNGSNNIYMNFGNVITNITNISEGFEAVKARELSWMKINMYSSKVELQRFNRVFGPIFDTLLPEANETKETTTGQLMENLKDTIINKTKVLVKHNIIISEAISEYPLLIGYHDDAAYFLRLDAYDASFIKVPLIYSVDMVNIYPTLTVCETFEDDSEVIYAVVRLYETLWLLRNRDFSGRLTYVAYYGDRCLSKHATQSWNYARFKPIDKESFTVTVFDQEDKKVYEFKYAQGLYVDTTDETEPSLVAVGNVHPDFITMSHDLAMGLCYGL